MSGLAFTRALFYLAFLCCGIHIIRRIGWGCWSHEYVRDRDGDSKMALVCVDCGKKWTVLSAEVVKGPAHNQVETLGKPITKVTKEWPRNVREWRRSER